MSASPEPLAQQFAQVREAQARGMEALAADVHPYSASAVRDWEEQHEAALSAIERHVQEYEKALESVTDRQQTCLENLRSHGVVFDSIGNDPTNWQHVAFTIYSDFCEAEAIARAALPAREEGAA